MTIGDCRVNTPGFWQSRPGTRPVDGDHSRPRIWAYSVLISAADSAGKTSAPKTLRLISPS